MNMVHFVPLDLVGIEFAGFQTLFQMDLIKYEGFINCLQTDVSFTTNRFTKSLLHSTAW